MKSYREHVSKQEKFSIRKLSVGVVSLAIAGLATVNTYGAEVKADEATAPQLKRLLRIQQQAMQLFQQVLS